MTKKVALSIGKKGERSCGSCTKCCEGWLTANVDGEEIGHGKACSRVEPGVGCTDYENRPEEPCRTFLCQWRANSWVPEEFSPAKTGNLLTAQRIGNIDYLSLSYAGKEIGLEYLSWFVSHCVGNKWNADWVVNGRRYMIGSPDFINSMTIRDNTGT
jgi:hypothetical protein